MSTISGTSTYDLLSSYSTAATVASTTATATNYDDAISFMSEVEELLSQTESTESDAEEVDGENPEEEEDASDDSATTSSTVSTYGSVYYRTDSTDPLDPDDGPSDELSFNDMLMLMIAQFQNQTIDDTASTTDMMNQLVQMTTMQAMTSMEASITNMTATNEMLYTTSLVGKEVTVGYYNESGTFIEEVGTVAGAGYYGGLPVIFLEGKESFNYVTDIMAVGRLPEVSSDDDETTEDPEAVEPEDESGDVDTDESVDADESVDVDGEASGESTEDEVTDSQTQSVYSTLNYVDYSNMSYEELMAESVTALG